jgi:hypothetical protein
MRALHHAAAVALFAAGMLLPAAPGATPPRGRPLGQHGQATPANAGARVLWPSRASYFREIQHRSNLNPILRRGELVRDRQNLPVAASGSFSSAYRFRFPNGKSVAVRVFHPPPAAGDRANIAAWRDRYLKLQKHLSKVRVPPEIVEVQWMDDGIRVGQQSLPVTVMPWIEARSLDGWIDARLRSGQGAEYLNRFARNWRASMREMRGAKIAHGDLHHGNVLIERGTGNMRFVDYDAMWTPTLAGTTNDEIGHPNYQHPSYHYPTPRARPYGPDLDNFSSIVIYLSARAVEHDPSLWQRFHRAEDHLIFTLDDYKNPAQSQVFQALQSSSSQEVRRLGRALAGWCAGPAQAVPDLETAINAATRSGGAAQAGGQAWYR